MCYVTQLQTNPIEVVKLASQHHIYLGNDETYGYQCHAVLETITNGNAPQPFYFDSGKNTILFFSKNPLDFIRHPTVINTQTTTLPDTLPDILGFSSVCCPTVRLGGKNERDAYLAHLEQCNAQKITLQSRDTVYRQWFEKRVKDVAEILRFKINQFSFKKHFQRKSQGFKLPHAEFSGVLRVKDHDGFNDLLLHGIGRHRAFGYGLLRIRRA